jgi:ribosomal protein L37E
MNNEIPEIICNKCGKKFSERDYKVTSTKKEMCPYCGFAMRTTNGSSYTDVEASTASDISAIDAWLDNCCGGPGLADSWRGRNNVPARSL